MTVIAEIVMVEQRLKIEKKNNARFMTGDAERNRQKKNTKIQRDDAPRIKWQSHRGKRKEREKS